MYVMCKQMVNKVNMASLQEQIDFMQLEYERCKLVYNFLFREFGTRHIHLMDKEISDKVRYYKAIIHSLQELKNIKNLKLGN